MRFTRITCDSPESHVIHPSPEMLNFLVYHPSPEMLRQSLLRPFRWWKFQLLAKETLVESRECLKFGNDDFIRRGHILNAIPDPLLDVYQNYPTAMELWKALEERFNKPDIAYAVERLSRHTSSPGKEHWDAVNRVFKYLKKTTYYGLEYSEDPLVLEGYTDVSWITDQEDYASTSRWIFTLGGGAVFWGSKKQSCLTDSSMAAEFVALDQSTLSRAYNQVYNGKSRHIGLRHRQLNQLINDGVITVSFLRSSKNLADPFTKGLPRKLIENTSQGIYGNSLDKVHLSECRSEAASYEFKGLALKHSEKLR
ncbi:hypothetical protein Tco_0233693 [Tanacetum coccineum]